MLFDQLPTWVVVALIAVCCAVKHTAIWRLVQTTWFQRTFRGRHWRLAVVAKSLVGSVGTYLIFTKFAGVAVAALFAVVDINMHLIVGIRAKVIDLFDLEGPEYLRAIVFLRTAHAVAYVSYIWLTLSLG